MVGFCDGERVGVLDGDFVGDAVTHMSASSPSSSTITNLPDSHSKQCKSSMLLHVTFKQPSIGGHDKQAVWLSDGYVPVGHVSQD